MSGEDEPLTWRTGFRCLEVPEEPGRRLVVFIPAPGGAPWARWAFPEGGEFALEVDGEHWRAVILSAEVHDGGVELAVRIGERCP